MDLQRFDAADLLLLSLFELAGFALAIELLRLASYAGGGVLLALPGCFLLVAHGSVLLGQTWYPGLLRLVTTMLFPVCTSALLAMPGMDVGWRMAALTVFGAVLVTYWISGRLFELGYELPDPVPGT